MSEVATATAPRLSPGVIAWIAAMLGLLLAMTASTVPGVRPEPGVVPLYDDWVQNSGYLMAAGLAGWRALVVPERRLQWSLVALALLLRAYGFLHAIVVLDRAPVYPSPADAAWLLSAGLLLAALIVTATSYAPRRSRTLALDALLAGVTVATLAIVLLQDTLRALAAAQVPVDVVATNLAYPLLDVGMLVAVVALVTATRARLPAAVGALALGTVVFAVVDSVFLYQVTAGTFRPGSVLTPLSLGGTMLIAVAGWLPGAELPAPRTRSVGLRLPVVLVLVCVAVLGSDIAFTVPLPAMLLASAGVIIGMLRGYFTVDVDRREADLLLAAKNDELVRFRTLVEGSQDFIAIATTSGQVVYLNAAGRRMVGLPADTDITTTTIADYLTEEALVASLEIEQPAVMEHGAWQGESTLRDLEGGPPTPVTINSFLMRHPETGEPWLLATVQRDISELRAAQSSLQRLADERQTLLSNLVAAQESERMRIAADVHDDSVQALAVVDLQLGLLDQRLADAAPTVRETLHRLQSTVEHASSRLRHLLFDLDSPAQRHDLRRAIEEAAATIFSDGQVRWHVSVEPAAEPPAGVRVTAYRIAKEAMINADRHARATRVDIEVVAEPGGIEVVVRDDGIGATPMDLAGGPGRRGLADVRDRARIAGGSLTVESVVGGGTVVRGRLPWSSTPPISADGDVA